MQIFKIEIPSINKKSSTFNPTPAVETAGDKVAAAVAGTPAQKRHITTKQELGKVLRDVLSYLTETQNLDESEAIAVLATAGQFAQEAIARAEAEAIMGLVLAAIPGASGRVQ
jgi:hypothetical protein